MRRRGFWWTSVLVTVVLAGVVSYWASTAPDGLGRVASDLGFDSSETPHATSDSPLADYGIAGVDAAWLSGAIAGVIGVAVCFVLAAVVRALVQRGRTDEQPNRRP